VPGKIQLKGKYTPPQEPATNGKETAAHVSVTSAPNNGHRKIIRITPHRTSVIRLFKIFSRKLFTKETAPPIVLLPAIGNPVPRKKGKPERFLYYISDITVAVCLAAPYLVTFGMTRFRNGQSTLFQRVIVMLWVVTMQIAYIPQRLTWSFLQTRITPLSDPSKLTWALAVVTLGGGVWSIPAMIGFVNVARMMRAENGTCPDYGQYNSPS